MCKSLRKFENPKILLLKAAAVLAAFTTPAFAQTIDFGNDLYGKATLVQRKGNIVKLSIFREVDFSLPFDGKPSKTITFIDCKRRMQKDMRFQNTFTKPDRQDPGIVYLNRFC